MSFITLCAVFLGGGLGSLCRFTLDGLLKKKTSLPLSTFVINTLGSFALGLIFVLTTGKPAFYFLGTGFCGGFTTFSTAMVEIVKEIRGRRPQWVFILLAGQILVAICAAMLGAFFAQSLT